MSRGKRNPDTPFMSTTAISPEKTAGEIQELLGRAGAKHVMLEFGDNREIVAVSFSIAIKGREVLFRLPVRWQKHLALLERQSKKPVDPEQARRTAWRVALRWLEAQLAFVETEMVEVPEIMLPFVVEGRGQVTLYEKLSQSGFLLEHQK
jgi:hypothetical protein